MNQLIKISRSSRLVCLGALLFAADFASATVIQCSNEKYVWVPVSRTEQLTVVNWYDIGTSTPDPIIPAESESAPTSITLTYPLQITPITEFEDDYFGWLDLTIEGLSPGQTVRVERFQVIERFGMPDELALRQSFLITDGALRPLGDAFNTNLPNDISSAFTSGDPTEQDGRIFAQINFYEPGASTIVGDYLFRVSSPTDTGGAPAYAPLDYPFSIVSADADALQGLEGRVLADGQPVAGAFVVKLQQLSTNAEFISGTTTAADGTYRLLSEDVDEFDFIALKEGYVSSFGFGTAVELQDFEFLEHDIDLELGTMPISGTLKDAATGLPLPGVELCFLNVADDESFVSGKISVTWTDASGAFSTMVTPGRWGVIVRAEIARDMGYVTSSERPLGIADVTFGNVENLELEMAPATSLIEGVLTNENGEEQFGVRVVAINRSTGVAAFGTTDGEGNFQIGVTPGTWDVSPFFYSLERIEHGGGSIRTVSLPGEGQSVQHPIQVRRAIAQLYGNAYDFDDNPVGRLRLLVLNKDLDNDERGITYTYETDGYYSALLPIGEWKIMPDPIDLLQRDEELIFIGDLDVTVEPSMFGDEVIKDIPVMRVDENTPRIALTLTDANTSQPIPNVYLHAYGLVDGSTLHSFAATDENGVASVPVAFDGPTEWTLHLSDTALQNVGKKAIPDEIVVTVDGALTTVSVTTEDFENPPLVGSIKVSEFGLSGGVTFSSTAESGRHYQIEASDDLKTWRSMGGVRAVDDEVRLFDFSGSTNGRRFYRLATETVVNPSE